MYNGERENEKAEPKGKGLRGLLFFANWLFVVFLSKRIISSPAGDLDFVVRNIGTFLVAVVMTTLLIHFSPRKAVILEPKELTNNSRYLQRSILDNGKKIIK